MADVIGGPFALCEGVAVEATTPTLNARQLRIINMPTMMTVGMFMAQLKSASIRRLMADVKAQNVNFYKRHRTLIEEAYMHATTAYYVSDGVYPTPAYIPTLLWLKRSIIFFLIWEKIYRVNHKYVTFYF